MLSKKVILIAAVVIAIAGSLFWSRLNQPPIEVWVVGAEKGIVEATVANTRAGTVMACRRSNLSMPSGGVVERLLVDEGDQVSRGQLLLELWNADHKAYMEVALQSYEVAHHSMEQACLMAEFDHREAERLETMASKDLVSEEAVDSAVTEAASQQSICDGLENQLGAARAEIDYYQAILERTQLRAPFDGVIAEINGEIGEYVTPSPSGVATPPAVDLIDYSCLYVTAPIDEVDAGLLRTGMPARVTLDAFRNLQLGGEVTRIAPYVLDLEKQARTVDIDVQVTEVPEDVKLLVGYSADVTVILEHRDQVLRVPTEALLPDDQIWTLERMDNGGTGKLKRLNLTTGISNWTYTQVLEGLTESDLVVRNPDNAELAEGLTAVATNLDEAGAPAAPR